MQICNMVSLPKLALADCFRWVHAFRLHHCSPEHSDHNLHARCGKPPTLGCNVEGVQLAIVRLDIVSG